MLKKRWTENLTGFAFNLNKVILKKEKKMVVILMQFNKVALAFTKT